jgi:hypothetical protein
MATNTEKDLFVSLQDLLKMDFGKEPVKHFTDIYQQANDDPEAIFCDSFLHENRQVI